MESAPLFFEASFELWQACGLDLPLGAAVLLGCLARTHRPLKEIQHIPQLLTRFLLVQEIRHSFVSHRERLIEHRLPTISRVEV